MPTCAELLAQYNAAVAAHDLPLAQSIYAQMVAQECELPETETAQGGSGGTIPPTPPQ